MQTLLPLSSPPPDPPDPPGRLGDEVGCDRFLRRMRAARFLRLLPGFAWLLTGCLRAPSRDTPSAGVAEFPEHYRESIAALGWPGAKRAFQIGPGSVVSTGECAIEWTWPEGESPARVSP